MGLAGLGAITRSKREQPFFLRLWRKESWATGGGRRRRRRMQRRVGGAKGRIGFGGRRATEGEQHAAAELSHGLQRK